MPPRPSPPGLRSTLWLLFAGLAAHRAVAIPFPKDDLHEFGYGYLMPRGCAQYCGMDHQYCCEAGSQCYTSNGIAGCTAAAGGGLAWYTTTWTVTQTYTKTYSSYFPAATAPAGSGNCVPPPGSGQIACGTICCATWQYCAREGQCMPNPSAVAGGGGAGVTTVVTGGQTITTQYSAPYRVTSGTVTSTSTGTAAGASETTGAVSPGGTAGGLSGGAIAGIVVGTLAGVALLLLLCACCVVRGLWHGLLALLGIRKKKETKTVIEEERYTRHGRREGHGSWYGGRPSTAASRKEKSKGAGLLGIGAALGTLALLLGLRRDKKKKAATKTRSDFSSSSWSESYTASDPSSFSSDRRTRRSGRGSRAPSRVTRTTHTHTRVSRAPSARSHRSPR
ncbi:hypothetical protein N656DRAFT_30094 [Canariomyces notabilis]|uniref:Uncharacterized protein n=1 Tax=Canariomyces notabilis TaxID=2074819 RepID=A0AAN6TMW1_9PEZI|nr:hypothetical protein N656DRAFT_30094 [Canariomyces arenarius]